MRTSHPATTVVTALNILIIVGILYHAVNDPPGTLRGWCWFALIVGFPIVNLLGLSRVTSCWLTFLAVVFNGVALLGWGGLIAFTMVWPLGSKPRGIELWVLFGSWLILVVSEIVLLRICKKKISDGSWNTEGK